MKLKFTKQCIVLSTATTEGCSWRPIWQCSGPVELSDQWWLICDRPVLMPCSTCDIVVLVILAAEACGDGSTRNETKVCHYQCW